MGRREWGIGFKNMWGRRERDSEGEYGEEREIVKGNMGRREWGVRVKNIWGRRER